jgi:hypothetical protein
MAFPAVSKVLWKFAHRWNRLPFVMHEFMTFDYTEITEL